MKLWLVYLKPAGAIQVVAESVEAIKEMLHNKGWDNMYDGPFALEPKTLETFPTRKEWVGK